MPWARSATHGRNPRQRPKPENEALSTTGCSPSRSLSAEISGDDVVHEFCVTGFQRRPGLAVGDERGERAGRKPLLQSREVGAPRHQRQRKLLKARVVPDEHDRAERLPEEPGAGEAAPGARRRRAPARTRRCSSCPATARSPQVSGGYAPRASREHGPAGSSFAAHTRRFSSRRARLLALAAGRCLGESDPTSSTSRVAAGRRSA